MDEKIKRKNLKEIVKNFTPSWFSVNMGTGILSILLYTFPFQFRGLQTIALVVYIMNVVMFCIFLIITIARYAIWPSIIKGLLMNSNQSLFIGTLPMGLTTITNFTVLAIIDKFAWGRNLAFVLWIIEYILTIITVLVVPYFVIVHHNHALETMNGTWLLPLIPCVVASASGGLIAQYLDHDRALVILIISIITMGMGLSLALSVIVIYFYRLIVNKLPPREVIISSFLPLGPLGQGAYGLVQLGIASKTILGDRYIVGLGDVAHSVGFLTALFLWGYGVWYLVVATFSVAITTRDGIPFNMGWWALTFPLGVFTTATLSFGKILDSMFFLVLGAIFTCSLVLIWLSVMAKTLKGIFTTEVFYAPCLTPVTSSL